MAQPCKDAGIATDAAGILGRGRVEDVMELVFDGPVAADGLGQLFGAGPAAACSPSTAIRTRDSPSC